MGKNNQQRRAARRRARAAGHPAAGPAPSRPEQRSPEDEATALIIAAARVTRDPVAFDDAVGDLVVFGGTVGTRDAMLASRVATKLLFQQIALAYEHGWQPADLAHVVRRELGARPARISGLIIVQQGLIDRAPARASPDWVGQLEAIADTPLPETARPGADWDVLTSLGGRSAAWDGWHDVLGLLGHWLDIHPMPRLVPPPSSWGAGHKRPAGPRPESGHDPKKLTIIRALLAKAEATEFAEEADAFTSKAQDLMTRYAIDEALLADSADNIEIRSRRIHIDNPYAVTKVQLLATVGKVNRVRAIWDDAHGIATVVGLPVDLDLAEMLFTSLLVQATRAMTEAGSTSQGGHRLDRSPSFRRAFLLAYANRIGERLSYAGVHAQQEESAHRGSSLLPVLARQSAAVDTEFARLFPHTTQASAKRVDARGWHAGRAAADRAELAKGQVDRSG